ncbi:Panacea domain-containing protein [Roseibium sp. RKSG952]|uniref:Panacea domain-containing protein n=1 Tax=Roseibium sp. RKSG952 TaxID=2529384 RepID=UPI0012BD6135|nr:Panacea domain-containing protein [Roseibium sp. RKSG952]MTH94644.1 DUF4065 domain-containing protein [Roseibium sp. RKSG952]
MSYEPKKAAQLIAYLIMKAGADQLNVLKAIKLVYLVDRESVRSYGFPVLDEDRVSLPHGPVNSMTLGYINGQIPDDAGWTDFLKDREKHTVALANDSLTVDDLDELSDADLKCADKVWNEFGGMGPFELRDWTHDSRNVHEWKNSNGGTAVIPLLRMLNAVGVPDADAFAAEAEDMKRIDEAFKRARALTAGVS